MRSGEELDVTRLTWLVGPPGAGKSTFARRQREFARTVEFTAMLGPLVDQPRIRKGVLTAHAHLVEAVRAIELHPDNATLGPLLVIAGLVAEVIACDPGSGELVEHWSLIERGAALAWTRGLCVLEHGMLIGTTRIRPSNADYFARWNDSAARGSRSAISYVPFDPAGAAVVVDVLHEHSAKVFSILPWPG